MTKVRYNGDISPCRIRILNSYFNDLRTGDVLDLEEKEAKHVLKNNNFSIEREEKKNVTSFKKEEKEEEIQLEEDEDE